MTKDKRSEYRCKKCIYEPSSIDKECSYIKYYKLCSDNELVDYGKCYKSTDIRFIVTNSCKLCDHYEVYNFASGFCRHPSFKIEYIGEGYYDKGIKLTKWNSLYIQFPERIHENCPLPKLEKKDE